MLNVSESCKAVYFNDYINKSIYVEFPEMNTTYSDDNIIKESLELRESILSKESIEFIGCIPSFMQISIYNIPESIQGMRINAYVIDDDTEERINLFSGYVDSATKDGYSGAKKIQAYDELYRLSDIDITNWYNEHYETNIYELLSELLIYTGVPIKRSYLANGLFKAYCGTKSKVKSLSALDLLKQICQINGGFGKINRDGQFQVMYIGEITRPAPYPSSIQFPRSNLYPARYTTSERVYLPDTEIESYRNVNYEDFEVEPITKVILRDSDGSVEHTYGNGSNKYIVQSNIFAFNQSEADLQSMARNIYLKIAGISYKPFTGINNGLPFLECGDTVVYSDIELGSTATYDIKFIVFNRTLKGIQAMKDTYSAKGMQYQKEFITDLKTKLDSLINQQNSSSEKTETDIDELRKRVAKLESMINSGTYLIDYIYKESIPKSSPFSDGSLIAEDYVYGEVSNV